MCGITGFISFSPRPSNELSFLARLQADSLVHRGPDDVGLWVDAGARVGLGHRRLSILDLSPAGHQPMHSNCGRYVLVFNGEIYNHHNLRKQLESEGVVSNWRGHSDTETLLAGFVHWGVHGTLMRTVGMFAIALWDIDTRTLILARDRYGEKPLYFGWVGKGLESAFVFGSELKALRVWPSFDSVISRQALAQYLQYSYVSAPLSIYQNIYKLEPGCILILQGEIPKLPPICPLRPGQVYGSLRMERWWSFSGMVGESLSRPLEEGDKSAESLVENYLRESISLQSLADVPLGAFLSGGVDSSLIVSLMQTQSNRPVKTFTVGFEEAGFDESPHACAIANHLGTEHHEIRMSEHDAIGIIPILPQIYDEPFADSSQIPTYLICQAARQHVTVALSGDAGDEQFGGYNRYYWGPRIWRRLACLPFGLREQILSHLGACSPQTLDRFLAWLPIIRPGEKIHKLVRASHHARSLDDLYFNLVSQLQNLDMLMLRSDEVITDREKILLSLEVPHFAPGEDALRMMFIDSLTYLSDDILCKVDRAAMACGLETRSPFLDHRIGELAWRLPLEMKIRKNDTKWILRQILYKYVPRELVERPKAGFSVPIGQWLRGPLREWADELLSEKRLLADGYFRPDLIRRCWAQHLEGRRDNVNALWTVLMFQAWLDNTAVSSNIS